MPKKRYFLILVAGVLVAVFLVGLFSVIGQHNANESDYAQRISRFKRESIQPLGILIGIDEPLPEIESSADFLRFLNKNYMTRKRRSQFGHADLAVAANWLEDLPSELKRLKIDNIRIRPEFIGLTVREVSQLVNPEFLFLASVGNREFSFGDWTMILYMNEIRRSPSF